MEEIVEGWKRHNLIMKKYGLPVMSKEEYMASLQKEPLEEDEDAIHAMVRNPLTKKP